MDDPTDEWLAADAALALVAAHNGADLAATSICRRAYAGLIKSRASSLIRPKSHNFGPPKAAEEKDCDVPKEFWGPSQGCHPNWPTGDFETWLDKLGHWKAFGVVFDRAGIERMLRPQVRAGHVKTTSPAITQAKSWLEERFKEGDRRAKPALREAALKHVGRERLSERAFNVQVWPELAERYERDKAGAKPQNP